MIKFTHPRGARQSKSYYLTANGQLQTEKIQRAKWWDAQDISVNDLEELFTQLKELEHEKASYITMGELSPYALERRSRKEFVRRTSAGRDSEGTVKDAPSLFACFDLDRSEWTKGHSTEEAIEQAIEQALPQPFHHASFVYQMSNSCLIKDKTILKCHLFFELSQPRTLTQLKALSWWPKDDENKLLIDAALFTVSQPIYTAKPRLVGINDPFGDQRIGLSIRDKAHVEVPLPKVKHPVKRVTATEINALSLLRTVDPKQDFGALAALEKSTLKVAQSASERHRAILRSASWLGRFVGSGRLNEIEVSESLKQAAQLNGYIDKVGYREVERIIRDGVKYGMNDPLYDERTFSLPTYTTHTKQKTKSQTSKPSTSKPSRHEPSSAEVINQEVERVIKLAMAQKNEDDNTELCLVKLPTGSGKSRAVLKELAQLNQQGKNVIYLAPNHKIIAETNERLSKLAPNIKPVILEGQLRACQLYQQRNDLRSVITDLREEGLNIPLICTELRCPYQVNCPARQRARNKPQGSFIIAAHAMLSHFKDLPKDTVIVIDESPQMTFCKSVSLSRLWSLVASPEEQKAALSGKRLDESAQWRINHYSSFGMVIEALIPLLEGQVIKSLKRCQGYDIESNFKRIQLITKPLQHLAAQVLLNPPQQSISHPRGKLGRTLISEKEQEGAITNLLRSSTLNMALSLLKVVSGLEEPIRLVVSPNAQVKIEKRAVLTFPAKVKICVLDATPNIERWKTLAQKSQRSLNLLEGNKESLKPHLTKGVWIKSKAYRGPRLFDESGLLQIKEVQGALNSLYRLISSKLSTLPNESKVGIGTHKRLAKPLQLALDHIRAKQNIANHQKNSGLADHPLIIALSRFKDVIIGHSGQDNLASNRFEKCDVLIIIGSPKSDLRLTKAEAQTINSNLDDDDLNIDYQRVTQAALEQWIGRLRTLRRGGCLLFYAGDVPPPQNWGLEWTTHTVQPGRPRQALTIKVESLAREALHNGFAVTNKLLIFLGATAKSARAIISRIRGEESTMIQRQKHGEEVFICKNKKTLLLPSLNSRQFTEAPVFKAIHKQATKELLLSNSDEKTTPQSLSFDLTMELSPPLILNQQPSRSWVAWIAHPNGRPKWAALPS